ncbi:T6SS effector amidase Tae4 family protein [Pseudomonas sp. 8O]|uniref:T6SS effector amidase Tae4 family protein n=1 Tax=Pseudomonas sp. 8O TaxID=2653165 RepID=UPI0012EF6099|nr:T6SS effector amidase Tae4 family protein [Pseudomonas sp. 8O]VXC66551.1 Type VI secretion system (T6SS), amidase effector protein 4 [Pseudomonas sp. 8O]
MAKPSFINLWNEYLKIWNEYPDGKVCDGPWANQCAIRMSYTLNAEQTIKVNQSTYSEPKCAHAHARGAESLANWLWKHHLGRPLIIGGSAQERLKLADKTGLIFFKDCFQQAGQTVDERTGDHIDLWKRGFTAGRYADPRHMARQIWFWELA